MLEFTVDRTKWLRGEGAETSRLYRSSDGKMCCMGSYCLSVGCHIDDIKDRGVLIFTKDHLLNPLLEHCHAIKVNKFSIHGIYGINDDNTISDEVREKQLTESLLELGVKVNFIN